MRVFVSHSSQDKPAVEALAEALRARGIDPWLDKWEIGLSGDFIASINQGLDEADAGIIVFSAASAASPWVKAEASYLTWARVKEGKLLIPVVLGEAPFIPPLLRPLVRHDIADVDAIADALHHRRPGPLTPIGPVPARVAVLVTLRRVAAGAVEATLEIDGVRYPAVPAADLPPALLAAQSAFLRGPRHGAVRDVRAADRAAHETVLAELGRYLGALCFPGDAGAALAALVDGCPVGTLVETVFAADDPVLLGLPFEAARLPDGRVLALDARVVTLRRPLTRPPFEPPAPQAGPLKILLAVAAPDAASGGGPPLGYERESQNTLDAVRDARRLENCEVRVLELGHPKPIADAFRADAYHVLHLSCHGGPGVLGLEDEDGAQCLTTAQELLDPIRETGKPLPLVLLNACHGGVAAGQTASFAQALLAGGVPAVLAMQAPVSDPYAIGLADAFYRALAQGEVLRPSVALAQARRQLERDRLAAVARGASGAETQPEYATAALFVASAELPLADFHQDKVPLVASPVHTLTGPVPQLNLGELIGRRHELREALGVLRDPEPRLAGVVLTGIGGVGKSALAGRIMCRLAEQGWLVPAVRGKFSLTAIATAIGTELIVHDPDSKLAQALLNQNLPDPARAQLLARALAEHPVLLVLDDFEQNLTVGGDSFLDPDTADALHTLAGQARTGRLLVTCRYPLPGLEGVFHRIAVPPLSPAEARKKLLRLTALKAQPVEAAAKALQLTGGHPRVLEFLDALLRARPERTGRVVTKLETVARDAGLDVSRPAADLDAAARDALALGERDVLLPELLEIVRQDGLEPALLQAAVSNLPVSSDGLARMLADDGPGDTAGAEAALDRLAALSLLHRDGRGAALVHRWTAEGLRRAGDAAAYRGRCERAGAYRLWRCLNDTDCSFDDAVEALRNFLAGEAFDAAAEWAAKLISGLERNNQTIAVARLSTEVLETLPATHRVYAGIADSEARAHIALGAIDRAVQRYRSLIAAYEQLAKANPNELLYQHGLWTFHSMMGDVFSALGQGDRERGSRVQALSIAEVLSRNEPENPEYQRFHSISLERLGNFYLSVGDHRSAAEAYGKALTISDQIARSKNESREDQHGLSVSYVKMGDLQRASGEIEAARVSYAKALGILLEMTLGASDPEDFFQTLSVAYERVGDDSQELGQVETARDAYANTLAIREALARADPNRVDRQYYLSFVYDRMGNLHRTLGQGEQSRQYFAQALAIRVWLANTEPDRVDYQRDLSVSYVRIGDIYRDLGDGESAREAFANARAIRERLVDAEPDRADYQRDLSISHERAGGLYRDLGQGEAARQAFAQALAIRERLATAEPDRADYQRDLSVCYERMGDLYRDLGQGEAARQAYAQALAIRERLAVTEPDRVDYQRDLSVSHERMGDLYRDLGQGEAARQAYAQALAIRERLAAAEPDRADYQRDLSISYNKMGDLYRDLGQGEAARQAFAQSLAIAERLAAAEPDRADYQRDLAISNERVGDLAMAAGQREEAFNAYQRSCCIWERLVQAEPDRADLQRGLVVPLVRLSTVTAGAEARVFLQRAFRIAETLQSEGRLAPADAGMLPALRQMLDDLPD